MSEGLPKGWVEVYFPQIIEIRGGSQPPKKTFIYKPQKGYVRLLQIRDFGDKPFPTFVPESKNLRLVKKDELLLARYGGTSKDDSLGRICTGLEGVYNVALVKLIFNKDYLPTNFIKYLFGAHYFIDVISKNSRSCQTGFNKEDLEDVTFPLPPLNEQKRIVAKLDAIMPCIEVVKERLDKMPGMLKRFRQSVLTAAVTGKLTEKWREENPMVSEWEETYIENLADYITSGSRGWAEYYSDEGAIFVRAQNINTDELILDDVAYVKLPKNTEGTRTRTEKYDLLVTITGANVTKTALVKNEIGEAYVNQHVALVRLKNSENAFYIHLWLVAPNAGRSQLEDAAYGAGKPGLNLKNVKDVAINLPPLEEQKEIVRQVDKLFALADKVEAHYQKAKARVDKLSQSVLSKAFRGELVPQDPNDESAEKLLERILEEKVKMESEPKGARKKVIKKTFKKNGSKS